MTEPGKTIGPLSWFLARRHLFGRERKALPSTITLISILGVAVGVAALIVVIGVMDGARVHLYGKMADLFPHLQVASADGSPLMVTGELLGKILKDPAVVFVEPVLEKSEAGLLTTGPGGAQNVKFIRLIGADDLNTNPIYKDMIRPRGAGLALGPNEVLLGRPLAETLKAKPGETITAITMGKARNAVTPVYRGKTLRVKGIYDTGFYAFDSSAAFTGNATLRTMFDIEEGTASYLYVRLRDPFRAEEARERLSLPFQYWVRTWAELNGDFFTALKLEKLALFIILLLIVLVAAFNIISTLILMVIEKTREVGILRAIGAGEGLVMRVFLLQGMAIGAVGTALGVAVGIALGLLVPVIRIKMPPAIYNFDHLPVRIDPVTVGIIVLCSMTISVLASIFPARQAAKLNPVEALRYD